MVEPITLAFVGGAALTEGIKFLYNQAGEILKRWRDRKDKTSDQAKSQNETIRVQLPEAFGGQWLNPDVHFDILKEAEEPLRALRRDMGDIVDGVETVDTTNERLLKKVDALRQLIEAIYQQRLTFKGESRPSSGPVIEAEINAKVVLGYVGGILAEEITSGRIRSNVKVDRLEKGGEINAVIVKKIGNKDIEP